MNEYNVIIDWEGTPLCIIQTTEVEVRLYNKVDAIFAYEEGEGDRSLDYWRRVHWDVFSNECNMIGYRPVPGMPLVCERFRKVYPIGSLRNHFRITEHSRGKLSVPLRMKRQIRPAFYQR